MEPNKRRIEYHMRVLGLRRSDALRLDYWLNDLHDRAAVQGEARFVEIENKESRVLVCTVDAKERCVGCAFCGLFAADEGKTFERGFKFLHTGNPPYDVRKIVGLAAILYCDDCLSQHGDWFKGVFGVKEETSQEGTTEGRAAS